MLNGIPSHEIARFEKKNKSNNVTCNERRQSSAIHENHIITLLHNCIGAIKWCLFGQHCYLVGLCYLDVGAFTANKKCQHVSIAMTERVS